MLLEMGRVDSDILYEKLMSKYLNHNRIDKLNHPNAVAKEPAKYYYGGFNDPHVYHPEENVRIMTANIRQYYRQLAGQLVTEGKLDKAEAVLDLGNEVLPNEIFPYKRTYHYQYTFYVLNYINTYLSVGTPSANEKAKEMLAKIVQHYINEFTWIEASNDRTIAIQTENIDNSIMLYYQMEMIFDESFLHQCDSLWQQVPMTKIANVVIRDYRNRIDAQLRDLQDIQGIFDNLSRLNMFKRFAALTGHDNVVKEAEQIIDNTIGEINKVAPQAGEQIRTMLNQ
jgi:tetratricopeptide (TPR) repeat protein